MISKENRMAIANIKMTLLCPIEQVWNHERNLDGEILFTWR